MRTDSHQHFWRYSPSEYGWIDDPTLAIQTRTLGGTATEAYNL